MLTRAEQLRLTERDPHMENMQCCQPAREFKSLSDVLFQEVISRCL